MRGLTGQGAKGKSECAALNACGGAESKANLTFIPRSLETVFLLAKFPIIKYILLKLKKGKVGVV